MIVRHGKRYTMIIHLYLRNEQLLWKFWLKPIKLKIIQEKKIRGL